MSLILALDTSTRNAALALCDTISGRSWKAGEIGTLNHGRGLIPAIARAIADSGFRIDELGGIVVGIGPGSYTGLRVGIAAAKTLAEVLDIPLHPLDSLLLPVLASPLQPSGTRASVADAQRGDVALSIYRFESDHARWSRCHGPRIVAWADTPRICLAMNVESVTGPGLELAARLGPIGIPEAPRQSWSPSAEAIVEWTLRYLDASVPVPIDDLEPEYLRPSAAEEKRQSAAGQASNPLAT